LDTFTSHVRVSWAVSFLSCFLPSPRRRCPGRYAPCFRCRPKRADRKCASGGGLRPRGDRRAWARAI